MSHRQMRPGGLVWRTAETPAQHGGGGLMMWGCSGGAVAGSLLLKQMFKQMLVDGLSRLVSVQRLCESALQSPAAEEPAQRGLQGGGQHGQETAQVNTAGGLTLCPHPLSSPSVLALCPHPLSSPSVLTYCPHALSSPSVLTYCPHPLSSPSVLTYFPHPLSSPSVLTPHPLAPS